MDQWLVTILVSSAVPLATLIYMVIGMTHKSETDYMDRIEVRLAKAEERLDECERDRDSLREKLHALTKAVNQ